MGTRLIVRYVKTVTERKSSNATAVTNSQYLSDKLETRRQASVIKNVDHDDCS